MIKFKKPKNAHRDNQKFHFQSRFYERVGYILSDVKYDELCNVIRTDGKFLYKREEANQSVFAVNFEGINIKVVYDPFKNILITVLS